MSAERLEKTVISSAGKPAISAWPLTIGAHSIAEPVGELVAQHRLIQAAEHPLKLLQVPGVQRPPVAVGCSHLRRDHRMGVDLGIVGP